MAYTCNGCGNTGATRLRYVHKRGSLTCVCDAKDCGSLGALSVPDVYFKGTYFDPNLADSKNPQGQWIHSREHKARVLKEQGLREAGDRKHGSRNYDQKWARENRQNWKD